MLKRCSMLTPVTMSKRLVQNIPQSWFHVRYASSGKKRTLYEVLELPRSASGKEIKTAFYRLSMKHHPDKNMSKESAAEEFREVSEAYQVLSNVDSKREYDGSLDRVPNVPEGRASEAVKSRVNTASARARPPPPTGRSKLYNFDEFYRRHYGQAMEDKATIERNAKHERHMAERQKSDQLGFFMMLVLVLLIVLFEEKQSNSEHPKKPD